MTPLHLSRLTFDDRDRRTARDLASPYALHQTLRWAFPGAGVESAPLPDGERLLWRQEDRATLLVQSLAPPDWDALNARHPGSLRAWEVKTVDLTPALTAGRPLRFRLRANVTVRKLDERGRSRRHALRGPHEQLGWLDRQGERHGFEVLVADTVHSGTVKTRKGAQTLTLHTVTFEGVLRVTNPSALLNAVCGGLGHAKALGCGLLSLGPG
ncbi:type I-E CRISPR-associated protein Cas6/Cse3/CasE [Deinococcus sp. MIMF12]|uniref:Type I-E CRISPR-associated protein Cas6/Cse3/CasE n=1 Tax=Deinococcus rhizophilus TaxID=3049544 RepID=A0ABT7JG68_9DEIO|nr:type I-E CRISPR-associated protein Cas6/Cse3/CasE [Deinococcus rhizophilus]MDL2344054.1 type I-E CRISPR-associated protein Cas6/Cse3/CasE [Deinococcus rhizophilus]